MKTKKKIKPKKVRYDSTKVYLFTVERGNVLEYSPSLKHDLTYRHSEEYLKLESEDSLVRAQLEGKRMRNYVLEHILGEKTESRSVAVAEDSKRNEDPSTNEVASPVAVDAEVETPPAPAAVAKKKKKKNTPYASDPQPNDLFIVADRYW